MATDAIDWAAIEADPRFQILHRRKTRFLAALMLLSVGYFFLLPVSAAWYPEFFRIRIAGAINVGIVFALSEFAMAWAVAALYLLRANREFDRLTADIQREIMTQRRARRDA